MFHQPDIRVVVADPHFLFRRGMRALLGDASGIEVIGEAGSRDDVLGAVHTHAPDLLLLDTALSGANFEIVKEIGQKRPDVRVLLLVPGAGSLSMPLEQTGAFGWMPKEASASELVTAIRNASLAGDSCSLNLAKLHAQTGPACSRFKHLLTRREEEVLELLMQAGTSREIAETLGLSLKTVESHKFNLMRKLNVHSRGELIKLAVREQLSPYAGDVFVS